MSDDRPSLRATIAAARALTRVVLGGRLTRLAHGRLLVVVVQSLGFRESVRRFGFYLHQREGDPHSRAIKVDNRFDLEAIRRRLRNTRRALSDLRRGAPNARKALVRETLRDRSR